MPHCMKVEFERLDSGSLREALNYENTVTFKGQASSRNASLRNIWSQLGTIKSRTDAMVFDRGPFLCPITIMITSAAPDDFYLIR